MQYRQNGRIKSAQVNKGKNGLEKHFTSLWIRKGKGNSSTEKL